MSTTFTRGENPLRADKLNTAFSERVSRGGDTMQGRLTLAGDPVAPLEASTKQYVDRFTSMGVPTGAYIGAAPPGNVLGPLWWDNVSGQLFIQYNDGSSTQWVSANSIDASTLEGSFLPLTGGTVSGKLTVSPSALSTTAFDAAQFIISTAVGSGVNGPATAQIGLRIDHQKQNWATTTQVGEIDGLYVRILQGGPGSDTAGVLVDVQSRGQGFTAGHEYIVSTVDSGFNLTNRVGSQLASIDGPTGQINGHTLSVTGATAFSATGLVMQSTAPADWDTFIRCTQQGSDKFVVSGAGLVTSYDHFSAPTPQGYLYIAGNPGAGSTVGGSYFTWNFAGVSGGTAFLNNKGGGTGGFLFGEVDNAGTVTPRLSIDGTGAVAVAGAFSAATISAPQVYANTALNLISNGGAKIFYDSGLSGIQFYVGGNAAEITGSGTFQIFGTQVITTRKTGWGVASGGSRAAFNSGTATLPQTAAALAALIFDLTAHGLIGA